MPTAPISVAVLALSLLLLAACGGGGVDDGDGTGVFLGAPVSGLEYETPTRQGVTDADGTFLFEPGEDVTFRVGDTVLGTARGRRVLTPLDLVPGAQAPLTNDAFGRARRAKAPTPETGLLNRLVFLQTLDADDDLDNGIQIPPQVRTLLTGVQVPFDRTVHVFRDHTAFRELLRSGLQVGLWGGVGRPIRHPAKALDHFYAHTGVVTQFERAEEFLGDDDGIPGFEYSATVTYSADERRVDYEADNDGDGAVDGLSRTQYLATGDMQLTFFDDDNDGDNEVLVVLDYDAGGNLERVSHYEGANVGGIQRITLDALGRLRRIELDEGGDGSIEQRVTYTRDAEGLVRRREYDEGANGTIDSVDVLSYDARGVQRSLASDEDNDGTNDRTIRHDAQGRQILEEEDGDLDGNLDVRITTTYDDVARTKVRATDQGANGTNDQIEFTIFDERGNRVLFEVDDDANGQADQRTTFIRTADQVVEEFDREADDIIESRTTTILNGAGNGIEFVEDTNADGTPESVEITRWAPSSAFLAEGNDN